MAASLVSIHAKAIAAQNIGAFLRILMQLIIVSSAIFNLRDHKVSFSIYDSIDQELIYSDNSLKETCLELGHNRIGRCG